MALVKWSRAVLMLGTILVDGRISNSTGMRCTRANDLTLA